MAEPLEFKRGQRIRVYQEYTIAHIYDDGALLTDTGRILYPSQVSAAEILTPTEASS